MTDLQKTLINGALVVATVAAVAALLTPVFSAHSAPSALDASAKAAVQKAFPGTKVQSVTCDTPFKGLCEVVAEDGIFYVSPDARYAIAGEIFDVRHKVNLTEVRTKQALAGGKAGAAEAAASITVDLPKANAIVHNAGAPLKLTVISDLRCGYCRRLFQELKDASDIEVTEYPIAIIAKDSGDVAQQALCSPDRAAAAQTLYGGGALSVKGDCAGAAEIVAQNTAFARSHGVDGTPTLIRIDHAVNPGVMSLEALRAWLKASKG